MTDKYEWLNKKTPRSVDQLKLWMHNPRLNPEENHIKLSDFVDDFTFDEAEKKEFFKLVKSIAEDGFIPADPVVVWQNKDNEKFYVAEGNRRVAALKLLREPHKAPKNIRGFIKKQAEKINTFDIEKIYVNVAPTLEDAEWYINQRNSVSSLRRSWSRIQQQRWINELYEKYSGDIEKITSITKMTQGELEDYIRILKIKDLVKEKEVKAILSSDDYEKAISHKFPITILERFFSSSIVKETWGVSFDGIDLIISSDKRSFLEAYAELIRRIIHNTEEDTSIKIDTRTITTDLEKIIESLPKIKNSDVQHIIKNEAIPQKENSTPTLDNNVINLQVIQKVEIKNNPNRNRLILSIYKINSSSYRIKGLFEELKNVPIKYQNSIAASIRIFLDLAVLDYIETNDLKGELCAEYSRNGGIRNINLNNRLEFLKQKLSPKVQGILQKVLNPSNELSLDVLNGYVHSKDSHYLNTRFLNSFWDLLFPLFEELLDIKENGQ